ncbi:hypothetical protein YASMINEVIRUS_1523 [Yasminevirus sp. GU-2018]|uniref:Uncharacterized protein n=1 Tax=Yasminevirus sp. GU-2018 TaxID=2420051 RepID=A0A5K0UB92_9VIRU|nr:hypothetical protein YASMINEVIRUS_1523 [Yasminevirus sp. GU-2018]
MSFIDSKSDHKSDSKSDFDSVSMTESKNSPQKLRPLIDLIIEAKSKQSQIRPDQHLDMHLNPHRYSDSSAVSEQLLDEVVNYAKTLKWTPYRWWTGQDIRVDGEPFWVGRGEVPTSKITSCSCTGLLNLIARKFSLEIPGYNVSGEVFPGGVNRWFIHLENNSRKKYGELLPFDPKKVYRRGTILFSPKTKKDQGHVAMIVSDSDLDDPMNNEIIHSYPDSEVPRMGLVFPGVSIEPVRVSHAFHTDGMYKFVFPPDTWLI